MYNAFYNLIYNQLFYGGSYIDDFMTVSYGENTMFFSQYLSVLLALVCTIIVYSLCCLCIYKVIRLFGRLWGRF